MLNAVLHETKPPTIVCGEFSSMNSVQWAKACEVRADNSRQVVMSNALIKKLIS